MIENHPQIRELIDQEVTIPYRNLHAINALMKEMSVTTIDRNLIDRSQQSKLEFGLDSVRPHARDFGDEFPGRIRPREVNVQSSRTYSSQSGAQQTTLSQ